MSPARAGAEASSLRGAGGFTLLELLVVLGIVALTGAVVAPSVASWTRDSERRAVRAKVVAVVRGAQVESGKRGVPVVVAYDAASGRIVAGETGSAELPRGWNIELGGRTLTRAAEGTSAAGALPEALFVWSPEGLASASAWRVVGPGGAAVGVECDAIEGVRVR